MVLRVVLFLGYPDRCFGRAYDGVGREGRQQRTAEEHGKAEYERGETAEERDGNAAAQIGWVR
jgi:hypothetical protein